MEDLDSAVNMVKYLADTSTSLRDRTVHVQFSIHQELKTGSTHSNGSAAAQAALQVTN